MSSDSQFTPYTNSSFNTGKCWFNGQIMDLQSVGISLFTHSLHYSGSVFEGIRVYNEKPFKLNEHLLRFHASANAVGYSIPYCIEELSNAIYSIIEVQALQFGYIRPISWRGSEEQKVVGKKCVIQTAILGWAAFLDRNVEKELRSKGLSLEIARWKKQSNDMAITHAKASAFYMMFGIVKNEAEVRGFDDALMLDINDYITEATTSNFFYVKAGKLYTPIADSFLDGITRQTVIQIAMNLSIPISEAKVSIADIENADAAFLTGTAMGIMPIKSIYNFHNGKTISFKMQNNIMLRIIDHYDAITYVD